ncbi:MAG TPA: T9SS type A sorting domain-containing protein [Bacteroidales bacterium]|nr:T9SS type A sorting domain-containing protein [Bacteroidales bacterium]
MKRILFIIAIFGMALLVRAQEPVTIIGFEFPVNSGEDRFNANLGLEGNLRYDIRMSDLDENDYIMEMGEGITGVDDFAAMASAWDNGANYKHLSIKFKAMLYRDFTISFTMKSDATYPDPQSWKLMWNQSGDDQLYDVPNATFDLSSAWPDEPFSGFLLPAEANYPAGSVYIYWMPVTNTSTAGEEVMPEGTIAIDNIIVTAVSPTGTQEVLYDSRLTVYPNPSSGDITLRSSLINAPLQIINVNGAVVVSGEVTSDAHISLEQKGIYFLRVFDDKEVITRKLTIR